jgi:hypothetical protein
MKNKFIILGGMLAVAAVLIAAKNRPISNTPTVETQNVEQATPLTVEEQEELQKDQAAVVSTVTATRYVHPRLGFSFQKPEGYTVGSLKGDDGSETLIVQPSSSSNNKKGFQVFITQLDTPIELTPNLIKSELPGTSVNNAQKIVLDSKGKGIMFASNNDAFGGKSFEIWFSDGTTMYQISSYSEFATELQGIIGTWKF